jgi:hypothetical protein
MLARMNFASTLAANQQFRLAAAARPHAASPEALLSHVLGSLLTPPLRGTVRAELLDYLNATGAWTGGAAQLQSKIAGTVHLLAATPEYQLV